MSDEWGFGNGAGGEGWKPFETANVDGQDVELAFGEHPHARRDNTIYAKTPGGHIVGFSGHRAALKIEVEEQNYLKSSELSGDEVRGVAVGTVHAGGLLVLRETGRDAQSVMLRLLTKIPMAMEHSVALWNARERQRVKGRKVYWRGEPAVVERFDEYMLEVTIRAETESGAFRRMPWDDSDDSRTTVRDDVYSKDIWWWRE